jgi:HK97 family phage prohead protease
MTFEHKRDEASMEYKHYPINLKSTPKEGVFDGYASVFNTVDYHHDVVMRGAFMKSLNEWHQKLQTPLLLWQHKPSEPVGYCLSLVEDHHGLAIRGQLLTSLKRGSQAYALIKSRRITGLSIGYIPTRMQTIPGKKVRVLMEIDLREISLVTLPANPHAVILAVKHT